MSRPSRRPQSSPDLEGAEPEGTELEALLSELRTRLQLASKEAQRQWEHLEERLLELERGSAGQRSGVREAAGEVAVSVARVFRDLVHRHAPDNVLFRAPVHDAMRTRVHVCAPDDTLARAAQLMWDKDLGCLPVCGPGRRPIAMLTDRDIAMASFTQWKHLAEISVESAMSHALFTCSPDDELVYAEEIMRRNQVRRLPVVDEQGTLVGLLSLADVARYVHQRSTYTNGTPAQQRLAETLAAIVEPRFHSIPPPPPSAH
jgi:CBS domain-containing protein